MRKKIQKFLNPSIVIFFSALIVRIYFLFWYFVLTHQVPLRLYLPTSDRRTYDSLAISFLEGYGLNLFNISASFRPPLYPIFLSFLYSFFGRSFLSYLAVFLVQAILSSLAAVFVFWIGKRVFNPITGFIAALIAIFYSPFLSVIQDLILENLLIFMSLFSVFLITSLKKGDSLIKKITCGVVIGLTILTKFVFIIILPFFAFLWLKQLNLKKAFFKTILIIYLSAFLVLSVWILRNFIIFRKIFISSQMSQLLVSITYPEYETWNRQVARKIRWENPLLNEYQQNSFYQKKAFEQLKKNPLLFIKRFFNNWPDLFITGNKISLPILIVILAAVGLIYSFIKKNKKSLILFIFFLLFCAQYASLLALPRFRFPVDWILILFAAYGIYFLTASIFKWIISNFSKKNKILKKIIEIHSLFLKFLETKAKKNVSFFLYICLFVFFVLIFQFLIKIAFVYRFPKNVFQPIAYNCLIEKSLQQNNLLDDWQKQKNKNILYKDVLNYQLYHHGKIDPFLNKFVVWKGKIIYLKMNAYYPYGSAKHPKENNTPEYKGFYDGYYSPTNEYTALDLVINRGKNPGYYGDGLVLINYKGNLDPSFSDQMAVVVGKIIGQNFLGQIYLEAYGVFR